MIHGIEIKTECRLQTRWNQNPKKHGVRWNVEKKNSARRKIMDKNEKQNISTGKKRSLSSHMKTYETTPTSNWLKSYERNVNKSQCAMHRNTIGIPVWADCRMPTHILYMTCRLMPYQYHPSIHTYTYLPNYVIQYRSSAHNGTLTGLHTVSVLVCIVFDLSVRLIDRCARNGLTVCCHCGCAYKSITLLSFLDCHREIQREREREGSNEDSDRLIKRAWNVNNNLLIEPFYVPFYYYKNYNTFKLYAIYEYLTKISNYMPVHIHQ